MIQNQYKSLEDMYQSGTGMQTTTAMPTAQSNNQIFNPIGLDQSYGTVDKYFGDTLKGLGYTGNIIGKNNNFFSQSGADAENMGGVDATMMDPAFASWAKANGISTEAFKGDDYSIMRLLQNGNLLGEKKYTTKNGLDKFAEVAGPLALAIGTGGVLGQALGFLPAGMSPLDPSTWTMGGGVGAETAALDAAAYGSGGLPSAAFATEAGVAGAAGGLATLPAQATAAFTPVAAETLPLMTGVTAPSVLGPIGMPSLLGPSTGGTLSDIIKNIPKTPGNNSGGNNQQGSGLNFGNLLSGLAGLYAGNRQQEQAKDFYDKLSSQFGPNSAYAQQLRQELERRDSASGRRSQYGPREVELQAKLADQASKNLTTMTALMDKQNAGLTSQLQAGIGLGKDTGLTDIFGSAIKNIGSDIWKDFKNTDFYKDLFDWFGD
jgi:hypothetical protein